MEEERAAASSPAQQDTAVALAAVAVRSSPVPTINEVAPSLPVTFETDVDTSVQKKTGRLLQAFRVMSTEFVGRPEDRDEDEEYVPPKRKGRRALSEGSGRGRGKQRAARASSSSAMDQEDGEWSKFDDNGVTRYRCELCGKLFNNRSNLLRHLPNHWDKKPYECADCGRAFPRRGQLMQHIRSHQDDFPFKCPSCTKSFKWKQSLRRHHCNRTYSHVSRDVHHPRSNSTSAPPPNARYLQSVIPVDAAL